MIHYDTCGEQEEQPIDKGDFDLPGIGHCFIKIKPFQDDELPPKVYLYKKDTQEELCAIRLLEPIIEPDILDKKQKKIITKGINRIDRSLGWSIYNTCTDLWQGMNAPIDRVIRFPKKSPKYYDS